MEGGIEGTFFDPKSIAGGSFYAFGDSVAVHRSTGDGLEDKHVESVTEEFAGRSHNNLRVPQINRLARHNFALEALHPPQDISAGHSCCFRDASATSGLNPLQP